MTHEEPGAENPCDRIHARWYDNWLRPRILILLALGLGAVIGGGTGAFWYISRAELISYDIGARERFVLKQQHIEDLARFDRRMERVESSVVTAVDALNMMNSKLDRNFEEIRGRKK